MQAIAATIAFLCTLTFNQPNGIRGFELWPVFEPTTVEKAMFEGKKRAAKIWGEMPGMGFELTCKKPGADWPLKAEGSESAPGHAGMNWKQE